MAIDLYWELAALFYEQDTVHLPGIGGFELRETPAEVDPVQGKVEAPSRQVAFDPNLVIDDGLLADRLRQVHQLSAAEAERRIAAFTASIKTTLDQGELVAFPGIGRLYRNYNGELQFLADGRNFSTDTFGLAPVELQTVIRSSRPADPVTATAGGTAYAGQHRKRNAPAAAPWLRWAQNNLIYIIGATALVFIVGMVLLSRAGAPGEPSLTTPERIPPERLNVPPSGKPPVAVPDPDETIQEDIPEEVPPQPPASEPAPAADRIAVIAVGLFGNEANVKKMLARINRVGMDPFTVREGNLTRVGVQVRYGNESELIATLRTVQARIEDGAFVLEKEGVRQQPR